MIGQRRVAVLLISPALVLIGLTLILPYLDLLRTSLSQTVPGQPLGAGWSLEGYRKALTEPYYRRALIESLELAGLSTLACAMLGLGLALAIDRAGVVGRMIGTAAVLSPLLLGIVVRSYGWTILLGNQGVINQALIHLGLITAPWPLMYNRFGIIISLTQLFLPFMVLPLLNALSGIDPALIQAARSLGASRWRAFCRVTWPLLRPALQSGMIIVFVLAVSAYATPVLIGGQRVRTLAVIMVETLIDQFDWPFGAVLALTLAAASALVIALFLALTRSRWR